jgi:hypothetical protein
LLPATGAAWSLGTNQDDSAEIQRLLPVVLDNRQSPKLARRSYRGDFGLAVAAPMSN